MKHTKISKILLVLFAAVLCFGPVGLAEPVGTAFTYQGRLIDANNAADGLYDFQFKLFDANNAGSKLGADINKPEIDVIDGYFTAELDFGSAFDGNNRWLEIGVRPGEQNDPCVYALLSPRQKVTPTPYALKIRGILVDDVNTSVGVGAGAVNNGYYNTFLGYRAGYSNSTGNSNTFLGAYTGNNNTTGVDNSAVGYYALFSNTTGEENSALGDYALWLNTTGVHNSAVGSSALSFNTTGNANSAIGFWALRCNTTGNCNSAVGSDALYNNTTGNFNSAVGDQSLSHNTTGEENSALGYHALCYNTTGAHNLAVGDSALFLNDTGVDNSAVGDNALSANRTGNQNTALGRSAGNSNITGNGNVFLGYLAGTIGPGSNNKLYIANSDVNNLIYGDFSAKYVGINTTTPVRNLHVNDVMRLQPRAAAPDSPAEGDIYMDSTSHKLMVYDGTNWQACW